ncbi:hypothetical protein [Bordetella petrii]|uniref:Uncharacterized protein n=1 Tax=Bordetella petrii TaxID=94624 RepID=A0ABT7W885_9BORD|nr:hypothetical protein [Bordetella petrii]MDM9561398.1 hypothetical protein [Bordetella petrii]
MTQDNGILRRVPGGCCAAASATLPPVETAENRPHDVVIEAGHVGCVRIYFRRMRVRHHKHSHWFWHPYRAESIDTLTLPAPLVRSETQV